GFGHGLLEPHRAGDLEGHFGGVDVVVLAVEQTHAEVDHRVPGEVASTARFLDALLDRRAEALRNSTAEDFVEELEIAAARQRLDADLAVGELAPTTGLLLVATVAIRGLLD